MIEFKRIEEEHIDKLHEIYNYYVENTTVTYHIGAVSRSNFKKIVNIDAPYESYAIIVDKEVCGYVLFNKWKRRQAFDRSAEVTVYLSEGYDGRGIGSRAVRFIEERAKKAGICTLVSLICGENMASIKLFEKNDYIKCAHFKNVGEKLGRLLDLVCYEKEI